MVGDEAVVYHSTDDDDAFDQIDVIRNAPITWGQLGGGLLSDYLSPTVVLAFVTTLVAVLTPAEVWSPRTIVLAILTAISAALEVVVKMTTNDGLARRLRAMGQIGGGR